MGYHYRHLLTKIINFNFDPFMYISLIHIMNSALKGSFVVFLFPDPLPISPVYLLSDLNFPTEVMLSVPRTVCIVGKPRRARTPPFELFETADIAC